MYIYIKILYSAVTGQFLLGVACTSQRCLVPRPHPLEVVVGVAWVQASLVHKQILTQLISVGCGLPCPQATPTENSCGCGLGMG